MIVPTPKVITMTITHEDTSTPVNVNMTLPGPTGPQGAQGLEGPQGVPGPSIPDYIHNQIAASKTWEITHSLNKYPTVTVVDSGGSIVYGEVVYVDQNRVLVTFSAMMSGTASLQ